MIDEKKLIEAITKGEYTTGNIFADMELQQFIKDFPKINEWILCSERLPEVDKASEYYDAVNVTLDDGRVVNGCYRNRDEEWWVDAEDGEKYSINATGHVIAWMPLLEPYKE